MRRELADLFAKILLIRGRLAMSSHRVSITVAAVILIIAFTEVAMAHSEMPRAFASRKEADRYVAGLFASGQVDEVTLRNEKYLVCIQYGSGLPTLGFPQIYRFDGTRWIWIAEAEGPRMEFSKIVALDRKIVARGEQSGRERVLYDEVVNSAAPVKPEDAFRNAVGEAISAMIAARGADFAKPKSVLLFLIAPVPYSDAEYESARRAGSDADPFWINNRAHKVFKEVPLSEADGTAFAQVLYNDLTYRSPNGEYRLSSFCAFQPMHAFEITFADGTKFEGAICVHCGDVMFKLPANGMEDYRAAQTKALTAEVLKLVPIPEELEARYFQRK